MKTVFADTSFYAAMWNPLDQWHRVAREWASRQPAHVVLTEFVIVEMGNYLSGSRSRTYFSRLVRYLRGDARTSVIPATSDLLQAGLDLYEARQDKEWSVTDCISFVVMEEQGLTEALSSDHHFEQAGFTILLK